MVTVKRDVTAGAVKTGVKVTAVLYGWFGACGGVVFAQITVVFDGGVFGIYKIDGPIAVFVRIAVTNNVAAVGRVQTVHV